MTRALALLPVLLAACSVDGPPRDPQQGSVTPRDFFVYSCMTEYMKRNKVPLFDGSLGYAVEYVEADAEMLERLHEAAKNVAMAIPAPNYSDAEHGSPAVLVRCQRESRGPTVEAILQ